MMPSLDILDVYESGELTVVGFGGREVLDVVSAGGCHEELMKLIQINSCRAIAFDMTGLQFVPSRFLGLLAAVQRNGVEIHLYNASERIREKLQIAKLDRVLNLHEVALA
jgi:anti-sigma B factor antagonist